MSSVSAGSSGIPKLQVNSVRKTFFRVDKDEVTAVQALDGVTFTVGKGEFVSIIGPSGCGKSTLLRIIAGLVKPDSGEVQVDGLDTAPGPDGRSSPVFRLNPGTVLRNVEFGWN